MKPILIIYATREGHARHIAEHVAAELRVQGRAFQLIDAAHIPEGFRLTQYCAGIIGASLHLGKHEPEMVKFVKRYLAELQQIPTLFLSVSLEEVTAEDANVPPARRAEAETNVTRTIQSFLSETGWHPSQIAAVSGALSFSKYNFVTRFIMKRIARKAGKLADTAQDYEFTDWAKLDRSVEEWLHNIPNRHPEPRVSSRGRLISQSSRNQLPFISV